MCAAGLIAEQTTMTTRRILVIDDNESIHADFRKVFEPEERPTSLLRAKAALFGKTTPAENTARPKFKLDCAQQGQEGLRMVQAAREAGEPYQVAFVDMRMPPGWDGLETIRHIWQVDAEIQVVVCTAFSDHDVDEINSVLGYSDRLLVINKPFDRAEVIQAANALSEKWRLKRAAGTRLDELEHLVQERTAEIEHALLHDKLTGLPNRTLLLERVNGCIERRRRHADHRFAVLFLDFDRFKLINDSLGHETGDLMLIEVARRLQNELRSTDVIGHSSTAARLGGDEFIVLLDDLREESDAARVASRLLEATSRPYPLNGQMLQITTSIGIATSDRDYRDANEVLRDADTAMYRAKAAGRARYVMFDSKMHEEVSERFEIENTLRQAVQDLDFTLHYQPILRLSDMQLTGFEALLRWHHPTRGIMPAADVIRLAEETGLILPLGLWVLQTACGQLRTWQQCYPGAADLLMSVNLSRKQLLDVELVNRIGEVLKSTQIDPHRLILEITETTIMEDPVQTQRVFDAVREWGVWLHLDDFGTGYSSLSCLYRLPLSGLKLDPTFLAAVCQQKEHAVVLEAVMNIARAFKLDVVAEGVETEAQAGLLRKLNCEHVQGFLFGQPQPADEAEKWIRTYCRDKAAAAG